MWSGAISAIPTGWVICDGTNSTPNLTDRFVIHADADAAGTNNVGDTGGVSTHTLDITEIPAHTHVIGDNVDKSAGGAAHEGPGPDGTDISGSTGGGGAHTNRDKYHALAYIMKT